MLLLAQVFFYIDPTSTIITTTTLMILIAAKKNKIKIITQSTILMIMIPTGSTKRTRKLCQPEQEGEETAAEAGSSNVDL